MANPQGTVTSTTIIVNLNDLSERSLVKSLETIVDNFGRYQSAQKIFIEKFPGFVEMRVSNIKYMNQLAEELDNSRLKQNIVTIIGTSIGTAGGIAGIAGALLLTVVTGGAAAAPLLAAAPTIAATGVVTATLGGLTTIGAAVMGRKFVNDKKKVVTNLLELDAKYFEEAFPWIKRAEELELAVKGIMNFNVFQELMKAFNDDPDMINEIKEDVRISKLPRRVENYIENLPNDDNQKKGLMELILAIVRSPKTRRLFIQCIDFFKITSPFTTTLLLFIINVREYMHSLDMVVDTRNALSRIMIAGPARMAALGGALSAVTVAVDIWILVSTSTDILNGSKSNYACIIRKCAERMQSEFNELEQIYIAVTDGS